MSSYVSGMPDTYHELVEYRWMKQMMENENQEKTAMKAWESTRIKFNSLVRNKKTLSPSKFVLTYSDNAIRKLLQNYNTIVGDFVASPYKQFSYEEFMKIQTE